ncbi:MAG: SM-20-related protein [Cycloclasticus sp.]|jgi:SM-20-related protein|tara:strand:+ start:1455 stop:2114 length:660 start_codon:yes stop_codon:yes gene_type:complete
MIEPQSQTNELDSDSARLFETIANDLYQTGYSIQANALPAELARQLASEACQMPLSSFKKAGVGRGQQRVVDSAIRSDAICWMTGDTAASKGWLAWTASLQEFLNKRLLLGLFSFESHFAHYAPGDFYKKHQDAFKGDANRVLSLVTYLNPEWAQEDGGELVLTTEDGILDGIKVTPSLGTLVVFLSEDFPHEVLAAQRDRYSIAGWFRVYGNDPDQGN